MKRLGLLVCIGILFFSITGSFFSPQRAFAAVTDQDYNALRLFAGSIDQDYTTKGGGIFSSTPSPKYLEFLKQDYESVKSDPKATKRTLEVQVLNEFIIYLNSELSSSFVSTKQKEALAVVLVIATQQFKNAVSAVQLENGAITAEQNQQNIKDATQATNAASAARQDKLAESLNKCSFIPPNILGCLDEGFNWFIKNILLEIAGVFIWVTANMLNYSIQIGILDFAKWAPDSLYPIWVIIRQIISLLIVFIGLYLGLMYILGRDEKFQKYIPWVIMFALFVNFSYPLARTAVDISNVVSLKIYVSAVGDKALGANFSSEQTAGAIIRNKLGLGSLFSQTTSLDTSASFRKELNSTPASLMALIFALYAAYIFFMAAIIMATRTAALVFLIVASPLLLVDSVLPMLGEKAQLLRKIFFEQLAVGPIFMIMLALTLRFLDVFQASGALAGGATGDQTIKTFFNLLMMLIMLHIMITVTKKTAGAVGEFGTNSLGKVGGFAVGAAASGAMAGTGMLARKGLGGLAAKARDSKWVTNNQDSFLGRRAYNLSNSVASSTFDLRNTAVAQKYAGKLGISSGMGAGVKMGYDEESKKKTADIAARSARIKTKYERDVIKDGKVVARKGDIDKDGMIAKERFHQNQGGALFLTKKQQADLASSFVDETSSKDMEDYKKLNNKADKEAFKATLNNQIEDLKKKGDTTSPKAQALMRSMYDIEKQEREAKKAFDLQLEKEVDRYNVTSVEKRKDYLARLDKDMREAINNNIDPQTGVASMPKPQATTPTTAPQPLTGPALRQERLQKVAEGRANEVELVKELTARDQEKNGDRYKEANDILLKSSELKQENSRVKAEVFSGNRVQSGSAPEAQEFDATQDNFAATVRANKLQKAAQKANAEMNANASGTGSSSPKMTSETPGTELPPTGSQPQASNDAAWAGKGNTDVPAYLRKNGDTAPSKEKETEDHAA